MLCNYLYTGEIPEVTASMSVLDKSFRITHLAKLYIFTSKLEMPTALFNKIMDNIQDGFALSKKLPEMGFIRNVYKYAQYNSLLLDFCTHSIIYGTRQNIPYYTSADFREFLTTHPAIFDDYNMTIGDFQDGRDPRVRDCKGAIAKGAVCVECDAGRGHPVPGYYSCDFHLRKCWRYNHRDSLSRR